MDIAGQDSRLRLFTHTTTKLGQLLVWASLTLLVSGCHASSNVAGLVRQVKKQGYAVYDTSTIKPNDTLQVLIGVASGSADGRDERAFFFVGGRSVGTDEGYPQAYVIVAKQSDSTVTLSFDLLNPGDAMCCPTGGQASARFHWNGSKLVALDPVPSPAALTSP